MSFTTVIRRRTPRPMQQPRPVSSPPAAMRPRPVLHLKLTQSN